MKVVVNLGSCKIEFDAPYCDVTSRKSKKDARYVHGLIALPQVHLLVNSVKCEIEDK